MGKRFSMEFFNNKRLLMILSGVACIMAALVIFTVSTIGFGNLSSFIFGSSNTFQNNTVPVNSTPPFIPSPSATPFFNTTVTTVRTASPSPATSDTVPATQSPSPTLSLTPEITTPSPTSNVITKITIDEGPGPITMEVGESKQLHYSITPADAPNSNIVWSGTPSNLISVDATGNVYAIAEGTASVKVKDSIGGQWSLITVIINPKTVHVSQLVLKDNNTGKILCDQTKAETITLNKGDTFDLNVVIYPNDATVRTVAWSSSKPGYVSIPFGSSGETVHLTAVNAGTSTITAKVDGQTISLIVIVSDPSTTTSSPDLL